MSLVVGDEKRLRDLTRLLFEQGVWVEGLPFPAVPRGQERTVAARGGLSQVDHLIDVGIQRRIDGTDEASLAATVGVVEQVAGWLAGRRPSATPDWPCVAARADPLVAADHALNLSIFTGVVQARLRSHA